ncbi:MAG: hypothetical protein R3F11_01575 [Verrucomicrobiales bacterium]
MTASDSDGFIYDQDGIDAEKARLAQRPQGGAPRAHPRIRRQIRLRIPRRPAPVVGALRPAFPCATKTNSTAEAKMLLKNGLIAVSEVPTYPEIHPRGGHAFPPGENPLRSGKAKYSLAKRRGSLGLGAKPNALRISWTRHEVNDRLQSIMREIHQKCVRYGQGDDGYIDYVKGRERRGLRQGRRRCLPTA